MGNAATTDDGHEDDARGLFARAASSCAGGPRKVAGLKECRSLDSPQFKSSYKNKPRDRFPNLNSAPSILEPRAASFHL